jgi:hypothetical protein
MALRTEEFWRRGWLRLNSRCIEEILGVMLSPGKPTSLGISAGEKDVSV